MCFSCNRPLFIAPLLLFLFSLSRKREEREKKRVRRKKQKRRANSHQHAYSCCRLRLSARLRSAAHKREKSTTRAFFFPSYNANNDTTFTSNCFAHYRAHIWGHPVHVAHCLIATRTAKEKERKKSFFSFFFSIDLYRCGLCLKRSHTVLDTIHTAAAVIQHGFTRYRSA